MRIGIAVDRSSHLTTFNPGAFEPGFEPAGEGSASTQNECRLAGAGDRHRQVTLLATQFALAARDLRPFNSFADSNARHDG